MMADSPNIPRGPSESFRDYVTRLEQARLQMLGEHKEKEAEALEMAAKLTKDEKMEIEARAKRVAAKEFYAAIDRLSGG